MQLPPNPSLSNLKKQAKSLLRAHRQRDTETVVPIRAHLPRLAGAADAEILAAELTLQEIQLVVAREYGFASWPKLVAEVERRAAAPGAEPPTLFTDGFKRAYSERARQESARLGNNYVGTEHLLLALLKDQRPHVENLLADLRLAAVDPDRIVGAIDDRVRAAGPQQHGEAVPYTPRAKEALAVARREAQALGDSAVQPPHLLLALLKDPESLSAQIVRSFGIGYAAVLATAEDNPLPRFEPSPRPESDAPPSAGYQRVVEQAGPQAVRLNHSYIGTEHLLLALLNEAEQRPIGLLAPFALDLQKVSQSVEDYVASPKRAALPETLPYTPRVRGVFRLAREECAESGAERLGADHLLLALCLDEDGVASQILAAWGVTYPLLKEQADGGEPPASA